jgi:hypothetical protein
VFGARLRFTKKRGGHIYESIEKDEVGSDGVFGFQLDFINSVR